MTFSVILRDPATGEFGAAIASSSPAVAARCVNLLDGVGGANSQNVTDPRLGPALLTQLQQGRSAQEALDAVIAAEDPATIIYRQLLVLDHQGRSAAYSGFESLGTHAHATRQNAVAGGNLLANTAVPDALVDAALSAEGSIEQRLQAALKAGLEAGGEAGPVHAAGLAVVSDAGWLVTDLRVDWAKEDPIGQLGELVEMWVPQREDYVRRGINPLNAPSFGVPGDE